jgi:hypothetical protein
MLNRIPNQQHLYQVCRLGQLKKTCRFLQFGDLNGPTIKEADEQYGCAKHVSQEMDVKMEALRFIQIAKSDNCSGSPGFLPPKNNAA